MKRTLAIILTVLLALPLLSCGKKQPDAPQDANAPQNAGTAEPTGETHPLTYKEIYNPYTDFDSLRAKTLSMRLIDTEDAYIFSSRLYLYYYDKATGDYDVLCPKPECMHDYIRQNKTCAGFMNAISNEKYCSYMGQIYYLSYSGGNELLCRMNYDTSGRENLFMLEFGDDPDQGYRYDPNCMAIHRGKLYGWGSHNIVNVGEPKFMWSIVCWDLETEEFSVIFEAEDNGNYPGVFFFGKYVYFANEYSEHEEAEDGWSLNYTDETVKVWRYDTETGETEKILDQTLGTGEFGIDQRTLYVAAEDKVYLAGSNYDSEMSWVFNAASGELEEVASVEASGTVTLFPDYFVTVARDYYKVKADPECPVDIGVWDYEGNALFNGEVPLDIVFNAYENIDHGDVGMYMPIWDEGGFFIPYAVGLDVETNDYESVVTNIIVLVRYEVADGELQEKLILVNHWPS